MQWIYFPVQSRTIVLFSVEQPGNIPCVVALSFSNGLGISLVSLPWPSQMAWEYPLCRCPDLLKWYESQWQYPVLEITHKRQAPRKHWDDFFQEDRISDEAVSFVTGDETTIMTVAEVDDSSDLQYSDREVDDSLDDSSDRVSQLKALI